MKLPVRSPPGCFRNAGGVYENIDICMKNESLVGLYIDLSRIRGWLSFILRITINLST